MFLNYQTEWWGNQTMQNYFARPTFKTWKEPFVYMVFHGFPYLVGVGLLWVFRFKLQLSRRFWLTFLFSLLLIGFRRGTDGYLLFTQDLPSETRYFLSKVYYNFYTLLLMFIPLAIAFWLHYKREIGHFFGIQIRGVKFGPYWIMLLGMVPLISGASFTESFLQMYPTYSSSAGQTFATYNDLPNWASFWIYEFAYILDYASIEVYFRGFLIFAMAKFLGKEVVFPMVAAYVWLHFGKPFGETLGSAFGGYILGITALYSRNIWGGIFIHMGVAFLMDVFAFWQIS